MLSSDGLPWALQVTLGAKLLYQGQNWKGVLLNLVSVMCHIRVLTQECQPYLSLEARTFNWQNHLHRCRDFWSANLQTP